MGLAGYARLLFVVTSPAQQDEIVLHAICPITVNVMNLMRRCAPFATRRVRASLATFFAHLVFD